LRILGTMKNGEGCQAGDALCYIGARVMPAPPRDDAFHSLQSTPEKPARCCAEFPIAVAEGLTCEGQRAAAAGAQAGTVRAFVMW
jgi:hypothetical protein